MDRVQTMNPFSKRECHRDSSIWTYRALTVFTWLLVLFSTLISTFDALAIGGTTSIWAQNKAHPTPFSINPIITSIYWFALSASQTSYLYCLFRSGTEVVTTAANVGSHFIVNNILQTAFFGLWVNGRFWIAEIALVLNFINLTSLYFRHLEIPQHIHVPVVTGPLAFTFVSLFWNGAAMVDRYSFMARVFANIVIWCILLYGLFFLAVFNDYSIGWALSILSASLAVHQLRIKVMAFQWIFAFAVMSLLFVSSLGSTALNLLGKELRFVGDTDSMLRFRAEDDSERAPLLDNERG